MILLPASSEESFWKATQREERGKGRQRVRETLVNCWDEKEEEEEDSLLFFSLSLCVLLFSLHESSYSSSCSSFTLLSLIRKKFDLLPLPPSFFSQFSSGSIPRTSYFLSSLLSRGIHSKETGRGLTLRKTNATPTCFFVFPINMECQSSYLLHPSLNIGGRGGRERKGKAAGDNWRKRNAPFPPSSSFKDPSLHAHLSLSRRGYGRKENRD